MTSLIKHGVGEKTVSFALIKLTKGVFDKMSHLMLQIDFFAQKEFYNIGRSKAARYLVMLIRKIVFLSLCCCPRLLINRGRSFFAF